MMVGSSWHYADHMDMDSSKDPPVVVTASKDGGMFMTNTLSESKDLPVVGTYSSKAGGTVMTSTPGESSLSEASNRITDPISLTSTKETSISKDSVKCPRCDSHNTKFCYFNNYNHRQPRHFCKDCHRYWTEGGALRNVPIGGGCRKNKRMKRRASSCFSTTDMTTGVFEPLYCLDDNITPLSKIGLNVGSLMYGNVYGDHVSPLGSMDPSSYETMCRWPPFGDNVASNMCASSCRMSHGDGVEACAHASAYMACFDVTPDARVGPTQMGAYNILHEANDGLLQPPTTIVPLLPSLESQYMTESNVIPMHFMATDTCNIESISQSQGLSKQELQRSSKQELVLDKLDSMPLISLFPRKLEISLALEQEPKSSIAMEHVNQDEETTFLNQVFKEVLSEDQHCSEL